MTYPPQGDGSGSESTGYSDSSGQSGQAPFSGQSGQPSYGSYGQSGQGAYGQSDYGQGSYGQVAYPGQAATASLGQVGPPSNIGWAVASILFFWPLSFVAMTRATQVYPLWAAGRYAEAEAASATAKKMGLVSLAILALLVVLYFVFFFVMIGIASNAGY